MSQPQNQEALLLSQNDTELAGERPDGEKELMELYIVLGRVLQKKLNGHTEGYNRDSHEGSCGYEKGNAQMDVREVKSRSTKT